MKKAIIFSFMLVLALGLFSCNGKKSKGAGKFLSTTEETTKESTEETASQKVPEKVLGYVDLGLPSGTLWKETNESGFYTWDEAVSYFGDELPTDEQFLELINECTWTWTGNAYEVTGPNGESITLPAAGFRNRDGDYVQDYGFYWSATEYRSSDAYHLYFNWDAACISNGPRCIVLSVRLVK